MVCNWILYSVDPACPEITKIAQIFMTKCWKSRIICYAKNVEHHAAFVEGFLPDFYARRRFMKYSMSGCVLLLLRILNAIVFLAQNDVDLGIFSHSENRDKNPNCHLNGAVWDRVIIVCVIKS